MQMSMATEMPIGYRFAPTDEELIKHYLMKRAFSRPLPAHPIKDIDAQQFYANHPKTLVEDLHTFECFFFIHKNKNENICYERKGIRAVGNGNGNGVGFWKSIENEDPIYSSDGDVFAFKLHLTYFSGSPNKARKTHWKMDEYRLPTQHQHEDQWEWVLVRLKRGTKLFTHF